MAHFQADKVIDTKDKAMALGLKTQGQAAQNLRALAGTTDRPIKPPPGGRSTGN